MPNLVLYRKYRPQNFAEIIGQEHVVQTLTNSIKGNNISHAYLFCGPRGSGKTTIARIFAKVAIKNDIVFGKSKLIAKGVIEKIHTNASKKTRSIIVARTPVKTNLAA